MPDIMIGNAVISRSGLQAVQLDPQKVLESSALNEAVHPALARICPRWAEQGLRTAATPTGDDVRQALWRTMGTTMLWVRPQMIRKLCTQLSLLPLHIQNFQSSNTYR